MNLLNSSLAKAVLPPTAFLPEAWEYAFPSLTDLLNSGIRALELDIHPDPNGGLYSTPAMVKFAGAPSLPNPALTQPGYKVLHIPDIDFESTCATLVQCLTEIKGWSDAHPTHLPLFITIETSYGPTEFVTTIGPSNTALINSALNSSTVPGPKSLVTAPPLTPALLTALTSEITSVFPQDHLITPDSVRTALTLPPTSDLAQHLLQSPSPSGTGCPWPDLELLRGKIMFEFIFSSQDEVATYRQVYPNQNGAVGWLVWDSFFIPEAVHYTAGNFDISLAGGVVPPTLPPNASAIVSQLSQSVKQKTAQGYLVRGRADADTVEARAGYAGRYQALLDGPSIVVATDYPIRSNVLSGINYEVSLPGGGAGRCVNGYIGNYSGPDLVCSSSGQVVAVVPLSGGVLMSSPTAAITLDAANSNGTGSGTDGSSSSSGAPVASSSTGRRLEAVGVAALLLAMMVSAL